MMVQAQRLVLSSFRVQVVLACTWLDDRLCALCRTPPTTTLLFLHDGVLTRMAAPKKIKKNPPPTNTPTTVSAVGHKGNRGQQQ